MTQTMTARSCLRIDGKKLTLNGESVRLFSGAMHYFRTLPPQWDDRLAKLKAMGLNCIETYVAWNVHEPSAGQFDYAGPADLPGFVASVAKAGMSLIVRPGPYICAEWEFGGLPGWLLADPDMRVRNAHPAYLDAVDRFFDDLLVRLTPHFAENGGPIIAMQIENEYGSYGRDTAYLSHLASGLRSRGYEGLLLTSDGPTDAMLAFGTLPDIWKTANFGSRAGEAFKKLAEYESGPLMCMEFWNGWFDHWGKPHHVRSAEDAAQALEEILSAAAHVNFYMASGGTNFGFMNGANSSPEGRYEPTTTSYDYDCPLSEAGDLTPKYHAFQAVLARHGAIVSAPPPATRGKLGPTQTVAAGVAGLFDNLETLGVTHRLAQPMPMEMLDQSYGFTLYRTRTDYPAASAILTADVRDRAQIFCNGDPQGTLDRDKVRTLEINLAAGTNQLDILVENMGRINYGPKLLDRKGLVGQCWLEQTELLGWDAITLPLGDLSGLSFEEISVTAPAFHRYGFDVPVVGDGYLCLPGWSKGVAWINGFNIGRYWNAGPQYRLYVPWPLLRQGQNQLILFETIAMGRAPSFAAEQAWEPDL